MHDVHMHDVAHSAATLGLLHVGVLLCTSKHPVLSHEYFWPVTVLYTSALEQPTGKALQNTCCFLAIGWSVVASTYNACVYVTVSG